MAHNGVSVGPAGPRGVYKVHMSAQPRLVRRFIVLAVLAAVGLAAYLAFGRGAISFEALIRHHQEIDAFVTSHRSLGALAYICIYAAAVLLSLPGAAFLTVCGGFLFGVVIGAAAAITGATIGAIVIFLIARTALGEPLLKRAGPRVTELAKGFRDDAFFYLLFLRLVPAFPFFLVNLVPAFAGVKLSTFVAATVLGIIPGALVYALAGTGLGSVVAAQEASYRACVKAGVADCSVSFDTRNVLTPELVGALIALGLLALLPVLVRRLRTRSRAAM